MINFEKIKSICVNKYNENKKIRYLLIGIINTIFGIFSFPIVCILFTPRFFTYELALLISYFLCTTISFISNKYLVFKMRGSISNQYIKFIALHILNFLINLSVLSFLVTRFDQDPVVVQITYSIVFVVCSYFWHDRITFNRIKI
jgi:putative flippase GtrA